MRSRSWPATTRASRDLNAEFRGKPAPTNVLSWPSEDRARRTAPGGDAVAARRDAKLGDIAIAWDTCAREAAEAGGPLCRPCDAICWCTERCICWVMTTYDARMRP